MLSDRNTAINSNVVKHTDNTERLNDPQMKFEGDLTQINELVNEKHEESVLRSKAAQFQ